MCVDHYMHASIFAPVNLSCAPQPPPAPDASPITLPCTKERKSTVEEERKVAYAYVQLRGDDGAGGKKESQLKTHYGLFIRTICDLGEATAADWAGLGAKWLSCV